MGKHKKDKKLNYFDAFDRQVELAYKEAKLLVEVVENYPGCDDLEAFIERAHDIEHEADEQVHAVFEAVTVDFVTPIDREDIILMTQSLDDVVDYMDGTIQRLAMYHVPEMHPQVAEFAHLLLKSCEALRKAMGDFRNFKNSKKLHALIVDVGDVEEEADTLFFNTMRELYSHGKEDPLMVFVWDKLFQRLENTADALEKVADSIGSIVMKNA